MRQITFTQYGSTPGEAQNRTEKMYRRWQDKNLVYISHIAYDSGFQQDQNQYFYSLTVWYDRGVQSDS